MGRLSRQIRRFVSHTLQDMWDRRLQAWARISARRMTISAGMKQRKQFTNTHITLNMVTSACTESTVYERLLNGSSAMLISHIKGHSVTCKFHHATDVAVSDPLQANLWRHVVQRGGSYDWPHIHDLRKNHKNRNCIFLPVCQYLATKRLAIVCISRAHSSNTHTKQNFWKSLHDPFKTIMAWCPLNCGTTCKAFKFQSSWI